MEKTYTKQNFYEIELEMGSYLLVYKNQMKQVFENKRLKKKKINK